MNELGLDEIPVIAIAKGKFRNSGNETFFYNGKVYKFNRNDPTLFFPDGGTGFARSGLTYALCIGTFCW